MTAIHKKSRLNRATGWDAVTFIALTLIAIIIFLPFYNAVVISLETNRAYALNPVSMYPVEFTLRNYEHLIDKGQIVARQQFVLNPYQFPCLAPSDISLTSNLSPLTSKEET